MEKNSGIAKIIGNYALIVGAAAIVYGMASILHVTSGCSNTDKSVMTQDEIQKFSTPSLGNYNQNDFKLDKSNLDKVMEEYETKNNASTYKTVK